MHLCQINELIYGGFLHPHVYRSGGFSPCCFVMKGCSVVGHRRGKIVVVDLWYQRFFSTLPPRHICSLMVVVLFELTLESLCFQRGELLLIVYKSFINKTFDQGTFYDWAGWVLARPPHLSHLAQYYITAVFSLLFQLIVFHISRLVPATIATVKSCCKQNLFGPERWWWIFSNISAVCLNSTSSQYLLV